MVLVVERGMVGGADAGCWFVESGRRREEEGGEQIQQFSEDLSNGPVLPMMKPITVGACGECSQGMTSEFKKRTGTKYSCQLLWWGWGVTTTSVNVIPETGEEWDIIIIVEH